MTAPQAARVTAQDFYDFDKCPHRVYLNRFGDASEKLPHSPFLNLLFENALSYEEEIIANLAHVAPGGTTLEERAASTLELMRKGVERIYHGVLLRPAESGIPDLLEKVGGGSNFGNYFYMPVDIKAGSGYADRETGELREAYGMQLYHYGALLEAIQGVFPPDGAILNRDGERVPYPLRQFREQFQSALPKIRALITGAATDEPALCSDCRNCQWWGRCQKALETAQDLTLLSDVGRSRKILLNSAGIRSIPQLQKFDFSRVKIKGIGPKTIEALRLAATVKIANKLQVLARASLPNPPRKIYLDFEDDPTQELIYLCGMWIDPPLNGLNYHGFFCSDQKGEGKIWDELQDVCAAIAGEDYAVFHFSPYEKTKISVLERRYGSRNPSALDEFRSRMVDLLFIVKNSVALPAKNYGLKSVAPFVGVKYSSADVGGAQSIVWFQQYQKDPARSDILQTLLTYNREDCESMKHVESWLRSLTPPGSP